MNSIVTEPYSVNKIGIQEAIPNESSTEPTKTKDSSKKNPLQCGICGLIICNKWNLTLHMRVHNNDRRYKCDQCSASFIIAHDLKKHTLAHAGIKPTYKCRFCDKTYTSSHCFLETHEKSFHKKEVGGFRCHVCGLLFETSISLSIHRRIHAFKSSSTGKSDSLNNEKEKDVVLLNKNLSEVGDVRLHECIICSERYTSRADMITHMSNTHPEKTKTIFRFACDQCDKIFKTKQELIQHWVTHNGEKKYSCSLCDYKAKRNTDLKYHMRKHTEEDKEIELLSKNTSTEMYECIICLEPYTSRAEMITHISNTHPEETKTIFRFACDQCDKIVKTKQELMQHWVTHSGEKKYFCSLCDFKAKLNTDFEFHMRQHTEDKKDVELLNKKTPAEMYECVICLKRYTSRTDMMNHLSNIHPEETKTIFKFTCNECDKMFKRKKELLQHMITHNGERKYCCPYCDYKSKRNPDLRVHMRKHTEDISYVCEVCGLRFFQIKLFQQHKKTHIGKNCKKVFKCELCGMSFYRRKHLQCHTDKHENGGFQCKKCSKFFVNPYTLKRHVKSGKCEEVGNLTEPEKITIEKCPLSIQSIEKRYECFACGFSTWSELSMSQHESSHNIADVCDKKDAASEVKKKIETNHLLKVTKSSLSNSNDEGVISLPSVSNNTVNLTYTPLEESLNFSDDDDDIFDTHLCLSSLIEKLKSNIVVINGKKYLELDEIKLKNTESVTPCLKNLLKSL
ncbi:Zinc finger protein 26 [Armadillidium vulgare]|nr:Zinc finger protein 26 [Armadillidium vulgare]